jgi:histone-lysine N-methyltransferase SETMAR
VNNVRCSEVLRDQMKSAVRTKRREPLSKGIAMLHDNVPPHTVESLHHFNCQMLKHPPCSPDLAPSDCHLFGPLKDVLRGRHSSSNQDVTYAVHA